jgi:hypothetical protein
LSISRLAGAAALGVALLWSIYSCDYEWQGTPPARSRDWGYSVQQTADRGYIIAGTTWRLGASDIYLLKTDAGGNRLWSKTFGGVDVEWGFSARQTADGGYIVAGSAWGSSGSEVYLVRTDAGGNRLWSKTFGRGRAAWGYSVRQTADGGYVVAGKIQSSGGDTDLYLVKTDIKGNELWSSTFGGSKPELGYSVQETRSGGYIVVGMTGSSGTGDDDTYLVKTDPDGNEVWSWASGESADDWGKSVQQTTDGCYIIAGAATRSGAGDAYLVKVDARGNQLWSKTYGGRHGDYGHSVQQSADGGYIIAGYTRPFGEAGGSDVWLIKTDPDGNRLWSRTFGRRYGDFGHAVEQTVDGGYVIVGKTGTLGGDDDIYLIKTDGNGNESWSQTFEGRAADQGTHRDPGVSSRHEARITAFAVPCRH